MTSRPPKDMAASVKHRLLNHARARKEDFNFLLARFAIERLLYRLGKSPHADDFILKGAMLFPLWTEHPHRPTRDVDLLGRGAPDLSRLARLFKEIVAVPVEDDGVHFDPGSVQAERIREDAEYEAVRLFVEGSLGSARMTVQIDVGFGDVVSPSPMAADFPTILDLPAPRILVYPKETVIAEKFSAMVERGMTNSRLKDYYDLRFLALEFPFQGAVLIQAVRKTLGKRAIPLSGDLPIGLSPEFSGDSVKQVQWKAFLRKLKLNPDITLPDAVATIRDFLKPVIDAVIADSDFTMSWPAGGPWSPLKK